MLPLRELLPCVTSDRPCESTVDEFVTFCRKTAVVLLRKKIAAGRLSLDHVSLSIDDLALDCVADLFARNAEGGFVQLQVYMRGIDVGRVTEAELMAHIRRLVFAKVNQGIYRIYHDLDPSLSRIIRNIKISIHALENYAIVDRFGEQYIVPAACDPLEHLPMIEPALMKEELCRMAGQSATIPDLLAHLAHCLREQEGYCRLVSLVQVALIIRSLYPMTRGEDVLTSDAEIALSLSDAAGVIMRACLLVKERAHKKYVGSGKVSAEMYEHYFTVVRAALLHAIIGRDGDDVHYYEELNKLVPDLSMMDYRVHHRSKIEYLGRITHREALNELKKMF